MKAKITGVAVQENELNELLNIAEKQAIDNIIDCQDSRGHAEIDIEIGDAAIIGNVKYHFQYIAGEYPEDKPESNHSFIVDLIGFWDGEIIQDFKILKSNGVLMTISMFEDQLLGTIKDNY
jgi:hypothetical protein